MRSAIRNTVLATGLSAELLLSGCATAGPDETETQVQTAIARDGFAGQSEMSFETNYENTYQPTMKFGTLVLGACDVHTVTAVAELDAAKEVVNIRDYKVTVGDLTEKRAKGADVTVAGGVTMTFQDAGDFETHFPELHCQD